MGDFDGLLSELQCPICGFPMGGGPQYEQESNADPRFIDTYWCHGSIQQPYHSMLVIHKIGWSRKKK